MEGARRLWRLVRNPLIVKDGLSRMRSWRAPVVIALYLGALGLFACLVLAVQLSSSQRVWGLAQVGKSVFTAMAVVQLALVCLFGPAVAAGAISGERERQTLDMLLVSSVTPFGIVWGKLVASVAFIVLLVVVGLPVFATVFLFGGVDLQQFVIVQLLTVMTAVAIGAASLFLSTLFRRTLVSTVVAYGLTFAATAGTGALGVLLTALLASRVRPAGPGAVATGPGVVPNLHPLLLLNPFSAMLAVLQSPPVAPIPIGRAARLLFLVSGPGGGGGPVLEAWQVTMVAELVVVLVSVVGSVLLLRGRRPFAFRLWPIGRREPETDHEALPGAELSADPGPPPPASVGTAPRPP